MGWLTNIVSTAIAARKALTPKPKPKTNQWLQVAKPKPQPKIVVKPVRTQGTIKVKATPQYKGTLKVTSSPRANAKPFNPQDAYKQLQQNAKANKAIPKANVPLQDQKRARQIEDVRYDQQSGKFKKITGVVGLTDAEFKQMQAIGRKKNEILKELGFSEDEFKTTHDYRVRVEAWAVSSSEDFSKRVEAYQNSTNEIQKSLNQRMNDADTIEEKIKIQEEWEKFANATKELEERLLTEYGAINAAYTTLSSKKLKDTRGLFDKFTDRVGGTIFDYTLGEKAIVDPKRYVNFVGNMVTPSRNVYNDGDPEGHKITHSGHLGSFIRNSWNESAQQNFFKPVIDYHSPYRSVEANTMANAVPKAASTVLENVLDPGWYFGVGTASKIGRGGEAIKGARKGVNLYKGTLKFNPGTNIIDKNIVKAFKTTDDLIKDGIKSTKADVDKMLKRVAQNQLGAAGIIAAKKITGVKKTRKSKKLDKQADLIKKRQRLNKIRGMEYNKAKIATLKKAFSDPQLKRQVLKVQKGFPELQKRMHLMDMMDEVDPEILHFAQRMHFGRSYSRDGAYFKGGYGNPFPDMMPEEIDNYLSKFDAAAVKQADEYAQFFEVFAGFTKGKRVGVSSYLPRNVMSNYDSKMHKKYRPDENPEDIIRVLQDPSQLQESFFARMMQYEWDDVLNKGLIDDSTMVGLMRRTGMLDVYKGVDDLLRGQIEDIMGEIEKIERSMKRMKWEDRVNPYKIWLKSVLPYRPTWYVNNETYNRLATTMAGGLKAQRYRKGAKEWLEKSLREGTISKELAEQITGSGIHKFLGVEKGSRLSRIATWQETQARIGLFRALKDKGLTDAQAVTNINRYLFNYTVRNADVLFRAVSPFWLWHRNVARLTVQLPVLNPRATNVIQGINEAQQQMVDKLLPDVEVNGFNPREQWGDKWVIPGTNRLFSPAGFFPFTRNEGLSINPFLEAYNEWASGEDRFGNPLNVTALENLVRQFPQFQIMTKVPGVRDNIFRLMNREHDISRVEHWISEGSLFTKEAQGHDPTKDNYKRSMDPGRDLGSTLMSYFMGVPKTTSFDEQKFEESIRYQGFLGEYFAIDWDDIREKDGWEAMNSQQEQVASDWGFDLHEEIEQKKWARWDSEWTKNEKILKDEARAFNKEFWDGYHATPKMERKKYANEKRIEWEKEQTFMQNQYYDVFVLTAKEDDPETGVKKGDLQIGWFVDERVTDTGLQLANAQNYVEYFSFWSLYHSSGKEKRKQLWKDNPQYHVTTEGSQATNAALMEQARQLALAEYRATPKGIFWGEYWALPPEKRSAYYEKNFKEEFASDKKDDTKAAQYSKSAKGKFWAAFFEIKDPAERVKYYADNFEPEYGGKGLEDPAETLFWLEYFSVNPDARKQMIKDNPQYASEPSTERRTQEEWDAIRQANRDAEWAKMADDQKFQALREAWEDDITRDVFMRTLPKGYKRIEYKV